MAILKPSLARKKVKAFLLKETDLQKRLIWKIAVNKLSEIRRIQQKNGAPDNQEALSYIRDNYTELCQNADQIIDQLVSKEMVPGADWFHIFKLFSLLSVVFVVPIGMLIQTAAVEFTSETCDLQMFAGSLFGAALLLIFLGAAITAEILKK